MSVPLDLDKIATAIQKALSKLAPALRSFPTMVTNPPPDCVCLKPADPWVDYHGAFSKGLVTVRYNLVVLSVAATDGWQDKINRWCSSGTGVTTSIVDALEHSNPADSSVDDGSFGLAGVTSTVGTVHSWGLTEVAKTEYGTAQIDLTVYCPRT